MKITFEYEQFELIQLIADKHNNENALKKYKTLEILDIGRYN